MNALAFLLTRLKEPSSYAGVGALLAAAGIHVDDTVLQAVIQILVSIAGLAAVLMPEKHVSPEHPKHSDIIAKTAG